MKDTQMRTGGACDIINAEHFKSHGFFDSGQSGRSTRSGFADIRVMSWWHRELYILTKMSEPKAD